MSRESPGEHPHPHGPSRLRLPSPSRALVPLLASEILPALTPRLVANFTSSRLLLSFTSVCPLVDSMYWRCAGPSRHYESLRHARGGRFGCPFRLIISGHEYQGVSSICCSQERSLGSGRRKWCMCSPNTLDRSRRSAGGLENAPLLSRNSIGHSIGQSPLFLVMKGNTTAIIQFRLSPFGDSS